MRVIAKFCTHCGNEVNEDAEVCINCGCMVEKNTSAPTSKGEIQVSLILGIVGIVFAWLLAFVGHITSIIGIVIGIKEYKETEKMSGLALSIIGEVCSIFSSIIGAVYYASIF